MFGSALETGDEFSDSASQASMGSIGTRGSTRAKAKNAPRVTPSVASTARGREPKKDNSGRPVSVLKPKVRLV